MGTLLLLSQTSETSCDTLSKVSEFENRLQYPASRIESDSCFETLSQGSASENVPEKVAIFAPSNSTLRPMEDRGRLRYSSEPRSRSCTPGKGEQQRFVRRSEMNFSARLQVNRHRN